MNKPRIADLFCGAGGAGMGLHRAGFEVVGFDIEPQPHYPFEFHQADALTVDLSGFDAVWASPPCQAYSIITHNIHKSQGNHPDLLEPTRDLLTESGLPFIIENVPGAPLQAGLMLCGTMFGLRIIKHRLFEASWPLPPLAPFTCNHSDVFNPWSGEGRTATEYREALNTPWIPIGGGSSVVKGVTGHLGNAVPPAYSEYLGTQLLAQMASPS